MAGYEIRYVYPLGTYSQWGIVESWSICPEAYKFCMVRPEGMNYFDYVRKYEDLKKTFNPVKFNLKNGLERRSMLE